MNQRIQNPEGELLLNPYIPDIENGGDVSDIQKTVKDAIQAVSEPENNIDISAFDPYEIQRSSKRNLDKLDELEEQIDEIDDLLQEVYDEIPDVDQEDKQEIQDSIKFILFAYDDLDDISSMLDKLNQHYIDQHHINIEPEDILSKIEELREENPNFEKISRTFSKYKQVQNSLEKDLYDLDTLSNGSKQLVYNLKSLSKKSGIKLPQDFQNTSIDYEYIDDDGNQHSGKIKISTIFRNKNNEIRIKTKLTSSEFTDEQDAVFSYTELLSVLNNGNSKLTNVSNLDSLHEIHELSPLNLEFKPGKLYYQSTNSHQTLEILSIDDNQVTLSQDVDINNQNKSTLTLTEFSKWASQNSAIPEISDQEFDTAMQALPTHIKDKYQISEDIPPLGSKFHSDLYNVEIEVLNKNDDETIDFKFNDLTLTKPKELFLGILLDGDFLPVSEESNPEENQPQEPTSDESTISSPDQDIVPTSRESDPEDSENQDQSNLKESVAVTQTPQRKGLASKSFGFLKYVATFGNNVRWISYSDAETIIKTTYDEIKGRLSIASKRKLADVADKFPWIGEQFSQMGSGARKEIVENLNTQYDRIGNWTKIQAILFNTEDPIEFYAASDWLQKKGYLPIYERAYLENMNNMRMKIGVDPLQIPANISKNRSRIDSQVINFYDNLLDPGVGLSIVRGHKNNKKSAIEEYSRQAGEIFAENPKWAFTRVHTILSEYAAGKEVDPHEFEGYLLGAYSEGVDGLQILCYLALGKAVKNPDGSPLIKGYESTLVPIKKEFIMANMILDGTDNEIISYLESNVLKNGKPPAVKGDTLSFQDRFGQANYDKLKDYLYFTSLTTTMSSKQNQYLEEATLNKDFAGYSLPLYDFERFWKPHLFSAPGTRTNITQDMVTHTMYHYPDMLQAFANILSDGPSSYMQKDKNYADFKSRIINTMKTYIAMEAVFTNRVSSDGRDNPAGTMSKVNADGTEEKRQKAKQRLMSILSQAGASKADLDKLLNSKSTQNEYKATLDKVFNNLNQEKIINALKSSASQANESL